MAKRQRGSTRPGQRPPTKSTSGRVPARPTAAASTAPVAPRPATTLTDDELSRAGAIEAQIVDEERQAGASLARVRDRRRGTADDAPARGRGRVVTSLAVVAADEYVYVMRDLRRIAVVFIGIFAILFASFFISQATGLLRVS